MAIPATIGVGGHAHDAEITDMQKAVQALLGAFVSSVLTVAAGGTGSGTGALAQEAWTAPTLTNSWVNFDATNWQSAGYFRDSLGIVHLRGMIKSGTANTAAFTLAAGYRPAKNCSFAGSGATATATIIIRVDVISDGRVVVDVASLGATAGFASLDGILFDTR